MIIRIFWFGCRGEKERGSATVSESDGQVRSDDGDTTEQNETAGKWVGAGNPGVSVVYPPEYLWLL